MKNAQAQRAYDRLMLRTRREGRVLNGKRCLVFTGGLSGNGYSQIKVGDRVWNGHRFVYIVRHGPLSPGVLVLHRCDNPPCLEDAHHFTGTHATNMADMVAKGRAPRAVVRGEANYAAKLTEAAVRDIRRARGEGETVSALARRFEVSRALVAKVASGRGWAHVQ